MAKAKRISKTGRLRVAQGRPPLSITEDTVTWSMRLTVSQRSLLIDLGGGKWVRSCLEAARRAQARRSKQPALALVPPAPLAAAA